VDGALSSFIPRPPGAPSAHTIKVCCFPTRQLAAVRAAAKDVQGLAELIDVDISPDSFAPWPFEYSGLIGHAQKWYEIVGWGLVPADDATLQWLMSRGQEDAAAWIKSMGLEGLPGATGAAAAAANGASAAANGATVVFGAAAAEAGANGYANGAAAAANGPTAAAAKAAAPATAVLPPERG
jgi:hypothetical protein